MADESVTSTSVNSPIAADVVNSAAYQRVKISVGADGVVGDATPTNPLPVAQVANGSVVSASNPMPVLEGGVASTTITTSGQSCTLALNGSFSVGFSVASGLTGTLTPEYTTDGINWLPGSLQTSASASTVTTLAFTGSANQGVVQSPSGAISVRLRCSAFTSGSALVALATGGTGAVRITDVMGGATAVVKASAPLTTDPGLVVSQSPIRPSATAQNLAMSATTNAVAVTTTGMASVGIQLSGTWTGTLIVEATVDGTTWITTNAYNPASGAIITTTTTSAAVAGFGVPCSNYNQVRLRCSVIGTGTAVVTLQANTTQQGPGGPLPTGSNTIGAVTISGTPSVVQSGTWTMQPGNTANTTAWLMKVTDGTTSVPVKPASTAAAATDGAMVVALSPNSPAKLWDGTNTAAVKASSTVPATTDPALVTTISPNSPSQPQAVNATFTAVNQTLALALGANRSVGFSVGSGSIVGSLIAQVSFDNAISWNINTNFFDSSGTYFATLTNPGSGRYCGIQLAEGVTHVRLYVSAFTSGSVQVTLSASNGQSIIPVSASNTTTSIGASVSTAMVCLNGMPGAGWSIPVSTSLAGVVKGQFSYNNSDWYDADAGLTVAAGVAYNGYIEAPPGAQYVRLYNSTYTSGGASVSINATGTAAPKVNKRKQIWKSFAVTTTQTSAAIWTPVSGKRIVVTHYVLSSGGTQPAKVTLYFAASGAYTEGTSQPLGKYTFTPTASSTPGATLTFATPVCGNVNDVLYLTTSAGITLDGTIYGYEEVG